MMKYKFILERSRTGYSAFEEKMPIYTTGGTLLDVKMNALAAVNLFEEENDQKPSNLVDIELSIDFKQFFEYYKVINAKHLAKRIGMNETLLSQYVTGKKKPSPKQVERIAEGLHEIGQELTELKLLANG
jgi:hypothetical protein